MDISIIHSNYNGMPDLRRACESISLQEFEGEFEYIVIDDGSTDGSLDYLERFASENRKCILLKNEMNIGLTKSLNRAIRFARGELILRQDSDDRSFPHRLSSLWLNYRKNPNSLLCSRFAVEGRRFSRPLFCGVSLDKTLFELGNILAHGTFAFPKSLFLEIGGYSEEFRYSQDVDLVLKILSAGAKVRLLPEVLYYLGRPIGSISAAKADEQSECYANILRKHSLDTKKFTEFSKQSKMRQIVAINISALRRKLRFF